MAFDVSSLGAYTRQSIEPLLTSAIFGGKTQELIMSSGIVLTSVKSSESIPLMDTDAQFQSQSCSFDASGTTTFTQRTVTVGKIKVEEKLCVADLETKFTQEALRAGSTYEDFTNAQFESAYLNRKNEKIAKQLEIALWQGDTGSADMNLNKFDGLIKLIDAGSPVDANVNGYTGAGVIATITKANVISCLEAVYQAIPTAIINKPDIKIFVGEDVFRLAVLAYRAANLYNYDPKDSDSKLFVLPGTTIEVVAVNGMNGTGDIYATHVGNMVMAVDAEGEESNYRFWYSQDNDDVRYRVKFKAGVNVAFTTECVKFKSAV